MEAVVSSVSPSASTTMTMQSPNSPNKKNRSAARRNGNAIPLDEMRRLMRVYGSIKCLRQRAAPDGGGRGAAKVDSVRRKFYRWFPDLDERFEQDWMGFYIPRFGHMAEMTYREGMRRRDGEILARKRAARRRQQCRKKALGDPSTSPVTSSLDMVLTRGEQSETPEKGNEPELDHGPMMPASVAMDEKPSGQPFNIGRGIFDAVEKSFYGETTPDCPSAARSSCSSSSSLDEQVLSDSWDSDDLPSIKDMPEKSVEECCDEILGSQMAITLSPIFYLVESLVENMVR